MWITGLNKAGNKRKRDGDDEGFMSILTIKFKHSKYLSS